MRHHHDDIHKGVSSRWLRRKLPELAATVGGPSGGKPASTSPPHWGRPAEFGPRAIEHHRPHHAIYSLPDGRGTRVDSR
jgi:hypothetical protein